MNQESVIRLVRPQSGYLERMRLYCRWMFPLPARLANSALLYSAFAILICGVNHLPLSLFSPWSALAVWNLFALAFILRLMDELKDLEIDRRLFADRPVPSGTVLESDVRFTLWGMFFVTVAVNLFSPISLWIVLICLGYTCLMYVYFFAPDYLRAHLPVNLATHNPSAALFLLMIVAVIAAQHQESFLQLLQPPTLAVVGMFWSLVLSWELSRKIRSREEENEYVTYSRIFGRIPATLITLTIQSVPVFVAYWLLSDQQITTRLFAFLLIAYKIPLFGGARFIFRPSPKSSRLKVFAEYYAAAVSLAVILNEIFNRMGG